MALWSEIVCSGLSPTVLTSVYISWKSKCRRSQRVNNTGPEWTNSSAMPFLQTFPSAYGSLQGSDIWNIVFRKGRLAKVNLFWYFAGNVVSDFLRGMEWDTRDWADSTPEFKQRAHRGPWHYFTLCCPLPASNRNKARAEKTKKLVTVRSADFHPNMSLLWEVLRQPHWSRGQHVWLPTMKSRAWFPELPQF